MQRLATRELRQFSPWIAALLTLSILVGTIALTLIWPSGNLALDSALRGSSSPILGGTYHGPQECGECHSQELHDWSGTTHAEATFDPVFQVYLQQVEQPGECFACHTTGYNAKTGQFVTAGVTCEACHGPYRPEHPGESMAIATSEDLCGTCHTSTVVEWEASRHGRVGVTCVDCHEVHTQKTRAAASTDALCSGCHQDRTQDNTHTVHSAANVRCIDCHLARPADVVDTAVSGHAVTGHSFTVAVSTCDDCHNQPY